VERTNLTHEDELLPPDYTGHPEDDCPDDDIIEESDEEARIEQLLNEQSIEEKKQMSNGNGTPFTTSPSFSPSFGNSGNNGGSAPWERAQQQSTPSWGNSWGTGTSFGSSSNPWNNQSNSNNRQQVGNNQNSPTINTKEKSIIICDAFDCLVETYESNGKPGFLPRAVFDLRPRFDVWEKLASFNPRKIYIIFPSEQLIPSLGDKGASKIVLDYLVLCVSTYLRIPHSECRVLHQKNQYDSKTRLLASIVTGGNKDNFVYVGVNSGRYGLSNRDLSAAREIGIDYIDVFNLLDGYYLYE